MKRTLALAAVLLGMVFLAPSNGGYALADGTWHIETVDSGGDVGAPTSIALDSSDNPHISYFDYTNEDLKYAYYDGSWHIETVDSNDYVGLWTSIALDSSDSPHISYYDRTNEDLKYAYAVHDIAVTNVTPSQTVVAQGYPVSIDVTVENQGAFTETFSLTTYYNGTVPNADFEKDPAGTSYNDISGWNYQTVVHGGNPPTGDDLQIVDNYYFTGGKSVYSYLQTTSVPPFPGVSWVSQYLSTEGPVSTTADYISLWIGGDGYTTSSRYSWHIALILTDGTNTYEEILRCDCWGNNERCTPNHYDYYDATETGADGNTWKRYTRSIPGILDKSNLTIKIRHHQQSWDLTQASSWYRLDSIYFSDSEGNPRGLIQTKPVTNLPPGGGTTVTFTWDTTGVALGDYVMTAHAHPVSGETDTDDNTHIDGVVTIAPDADGDGIPDDVDNCPDAYNPGQADCDGDGVPGSQPDPGANWGGDACDSDDDNDGYSDDDETDKESDPLDLDSTPEHCDGVDNDEDGYEAGGPATPGDGDCRDGIDNDLDTFFDEDDPECAPYVDEGYDRNPANGTPDCQETAGPDMDNDTYTDIEEQYMTTDELADCVTDYGTDAWPPDISMDGQIQVGDIIAGFYGKILVPDKYDRRADFNADGQLLVGDVIRGYWGKIFDTCN